MAVSVSGLPACTVSMSAGLVTVVVVANVPGGGVVGLFMIFTLAVPEDALCVELPEYTPFTVLVEAVKNLAEQDVDPLDR